jgi:hypothetical protein
MINWMMFVVACALFAALVIIPIVIIDNYVLDLVQKRYKPH